MRAFISLFLLIILPTFVYANHHQLHLTDDEAEWLDAQETITLGVTENWPPHSYHDSDGNLVGYDIDIINMLNKRLDGKLEAVSAPWSQHLEDCKNGKLDGLVSMKITEKRKELYNFTKVYSSSPYVIIAPKDSPEIISLSELHGKTVAFEEGFFIGQHLIDHEPNIKLLTYPSTNKSLKAVQNGDADAYIGNQKVVQYFLKSSQFNNLAQHAIVTNISASNAIATRKDAPQLASILNKALRTITNREKQQEAINVGRKKLFSNEEIKWLEENPVIRVGAETDWPPFDFVENNKVEGYSNDYLRLIAKRAGLELQFTHGYSWDKLLEMFKNKELDLLSSAAITEDRKLYTIFSNPYYINSNGIFVEKTNNIVHSLNDLTGKKLAVVSGYSTNSFITKNYPQIEQVIFNSPAEALSAVGKGKADAYIDYISIGNYLLKNEKINNIKVGGTADTFSREESSLHFMVNNSHPTLASIINKSIASINLTELYAIENKWLFSKFLSKYNSNLNTTEKSWLSEFDSLKIAIADIFPPPIIVKGENKLQGVLVDYIHDIERKLNVNIEIDLINKNDIQRTLENKECDIIIGNKYDKGLLSTLPIKSTIGSMPLSVITPKDAPFISNAINLDNHIVGVQKSSTIQQVLKNNINNIKIREYTSLLKAFEDLSNKHISTVVTNSATFYYLQQLQLIDQSLVLNNVLPFNASATVYVRSDLAPLDVILDKLIGSISEEENSAIIDKWTNIQIQQTTDWALITKILVAVAVIGLFIILWSVYLAREVKKRTESEARLQQVVEQISDIMWEIDLNGKLLFITENVEKLLGYTKKETQDSNFLSFVDPAHLEDVQKQFLQFVKNDLPITNFNKWILTKDGHRRCLSGDAVPLRDSEGNLIGYRGADKDVTEEIYQKEIHDLTAWLSNNINNLSYDEIYKANIDKALEVTESEVGFLASINNQQIVFDYISDTAGLIEVNGQDLLHQRINIKTEIWADCITKRKPIVFNNFAEEPEKANWLPGNQVPISRIILIPLYSDDQVTSIFGIANKNSLYGENELRNAQNIAHHLWENILHKRAEDALSHSEARLKNIIKLAPVGIGLVSNRTFLEMNDAMCNITGYSRDELIGENSRILYLSKEDYDKAGADTYSMITKDGIAHTKFKWKRKDGAIIDMEGHLAPIDPDNISEGITFTAMDVTEQNKAISALKEHREHLQRILDSMPVSVFVKTLDYNYLMVNRYWELVSGQTREAAIGNSGYDLFDIETQKLDWETHYKVLESKTPIAVEESLPTPKGPRIFLTNYSPLLDSQNQPYAICGVATDITTNKENEIKIQQYAETQARLLQEVNHRVKNNLTAIISMLHIEEDRAVTEGSNFANPLKVLENRVSGLLTVHGMLSASQWQPLELESLCQEVLYQSLQGMLHPDHYQLHIQQIDSVIGSNSSHHLTLILNELATNSVKHFAGHSDQLKVKVEFQNEDDMLCLYYSDNGPGFPQEIISEDIILDSIGVEMINNLVQSNLDGTITRFNENGAITKICFPIGIKPEKSEAGGNIG